MMIKCKKQFIALFMAISVIFSVGSETYIKAEALEWAVPTITAGEAIKWLLGLLGVTVAGGALANTDYDQLVENYNNYAEIKGQTAIETGKFWEDIIDGTLDQGSKAWANFKEWVSSLSKPIFTNNYISCNISQIAETLGYSVDRDFQVNFAYGVFSSDSFSVSGSSNKNMNLIIYSPTADTVSNTGSLDISKYGNNGLKMINPYSSNVAYNVYTYTLSKKGVLTLLNSSILRPSNGGDIFDLTGCNQVLLYGAIAGITALPSMVTQWNFALKNTFLKALDNVANLGLIVSSAVSDAIPDVIPLPWDQVAGTAEGINDKINELIDKVNEGVLSLDDYMVAIQSILGVIAFDTTNDLVVPANPDLPDETIKDKVNENVNNNGFVLTGLENFFPFCIPFDIYSFITILVAEPVAPVINWHIYNPVTKSDNIITLDFSVWEPIVILFRYIFDFLFIIGLALIARSLIGGDD